MAARAQASHPIGTQKSMVVPDLYVFPSGIFVDCRFPTFFMKMSKSARHDSIESCERAPKLEQFPTGFPPFTTRGSPVVFGADAHFEDWIYEGTVRMY